MKKIKNILSIILVFVILLSFTIIASSAITTYGVDGFSLVLINNEKEFSVYSYDGTQTDLQIPATYNLKYITAISRNAFLSNHSIKSLKTNEYIKTIGEYACSDCIELTEVALAASVNEIGTMAFSYCPKLNIITILNTNANIAGDAFSNSSNVVIYCYTDSTAHQYAVSKNIDYVLIDAPKEKYIIGDTDNDKLIAITDATDIQKILAKMLEDEDDKMSQRGDSDEDGILTIVDATAIQKYLAHIESGCNIGKEKEYK